MLPSGFKIVEIDGKEFLSVANEFAEIIRKRKMNSIIRFFIGIY
jgi:hypothetical protein